MSHFCNSLSAGPGVSSMPSTIPMAFASPEMQKRAVQSDPSLFAAPRPDKNIFSAPFQSSRRRIPRLFALADESGPRQSGNEWSANNEDDDDEDGDIGLDFYTDDLDDEEFNFDESALLEYDLLGEEDEILDELDLAEGLLADDEFLMQIDDDFIISAKRLDDPDHEGASAFEEDPSYRNIDDDTLLEILGLPDEEEAGYDAPEKEVRNAARYLDDVFAQEDQQRSSSGSASAAAETYLDLTKSAPEPPSFFQPLESALAQGVVPTEAGVGSGALPGDFGFDPLDLATKDYFKQTQRFLLSLLPGEPSTDEAGKENEQDIGYDGGALPKGMRGIGDLEVRPLSLIIRDYREAEIRHGRLAMLAAIFWPLQELVDRALIPDSFGHTTFVYGGPTLPFFPLLMTFIMLNLGYLDIFASEIKKDESGEAFLPGECFWDPLKMLQDAPDDMKRNFQQRELFNGRIAMLAVGAFIFEEALTHKPLILGNISQYLFNPIYEIPSIQAWFDSQFGGGSSPVFTLDGDGQVNFIDALKQDSFDTLKRALDEEADRLVEQEMSGSRANDPIPDTYSMKFNR